MYSNLTFPNDTNVSQAFFGNHDLRGHPKWLSIMRVVLMSVITLMSLFGNILVLACIRRIDELKTMTGLFIANLAVSDLGVGLICLPFAIAASIDEELLKNKLICSMDGFSLVLFFIGSIETLCMISVHKYITVVYPMRTVITKKRAYIMIASVWVLSLALASGPLFGWSKYVYKDGRHQCTPSPPKNALERSYFFLLLGFGYVIPVTTMLFCYSRLYFTSRKHLRRLRANAITNENVTNSESKLINTLVLILMAFILCWLPFVVYITFGISRRPIPFYLPTIAFLFGYGNSALNPIIYVLRHQSFRKGFWEVICLTTMSHRSNDATFVSIVSRYSPKLRVRKQRMQPSPKNVATSAENSGGNSSHLKNGDVIEKVSPRSRNSSPLLKRDIIEIVDRRELTCEESQLQENDV